MDLRVFLNRYPSIALYQHNFRVPLCSESLLYVALLPSTPLLLLPCLLRTRVLPYYAVSLQHVGHRPLDIRNVSSVLDHSILKLRPSFLHYQVRSPCYEVCPKQRPNFQFFHSRQAFSIARLHCSIPSLRQKIHSHQVKHPSDAARFPFQQLYTSQFCLILSLHCHLCGTLSTPLSRRDNICASAGMLPAILLVHQSVQGRFCHLSPAFLSN